MWLSAHEIPMPDEQLNHAISLIKSGQKEPARSILARLVQAEPNNAVAWLWLAETMPDDDGRIAVLEACLKQNPQSQMAQRGLERLRERQVATRLPPNGIAPTIPVPLNAPPEKSSSPLPLQVQSGQPEDDKQSRKPLEEHPAQSLPRDTTAAEDINSLREALTGKTKSPKIEHVPVIPGPVDIDMPAAIEARTRKPKEPAAGLTTGLHGKRGVARKPKARRHRQSCMRWLILVLLGLLAVGAVGTTGYIMRDQLRGWLGLIDTTAVPTLEGNAQLTPGGDNLNSQTTPTQPAPTPTFTPTPTITPVPTPTATVAFAFLYPIISPENGAQVVQVGELSSIPAQSVAISSDNRLLAAGLDDFTVIVWNLSAGNSIQIFQGHTKPVSSLDFSPDNRFLLSGSEDGTLRIWDVNAGIEIKTLIGHSNPVKSVVFSPDGNTFASGSLDGNIKLWQLGANTAPRILPAGRPITSLDFSPDGRLLAAGLQTGAAQVWDVATGSLLKTLQGHGGSVNSIKFAPSGHRLATGSADKTVKLWDVDGGKALYTIGTHTDVVVSVSFSPDGRVLASVSLGQTIKLWDVAERREIVNLRHAWNMPALTFSADGRVLAAAMSPTNPASREGGVALWGVLFNPEATPVLENITLDALQGSKWVPGARMATPHVAHKAVTVAGGRVLIIGGGMADDPASFTNKVVLYNPANGSSLFTGALKIGRGAFSTTLLMDGRVLVVGGFNASLQQEISAEIYDPVSGGWSLTKLNYNHGSGHSATLMLDGRVLVAGGCVGDGLTGISDRVELFDPATNSWTEVSAMSHPRCNPIAVLLTDGRVLVAGGEDGEGSLSSAEMFDPVTGQWSKTGDLITSRSDAVAVRLLDGRVMITGGQAKVSNGLVTLNTVEIYDAQLGKWEQAAPMTHARYGHTADLLPGGLVLVVGGLDGTDANAKLFLDGVEVYNPDAGTWTPIASLNVPRAYHETILLPDGRIFVSGGISTDGSILASTEILAAGRPVINHTPTAVEESTIEPTITPETGITPTPTHEN